MPPSASIVRKLALGVGVVTAGVVAAMELRRRYANTTDLGHQIERTAQLTRAGAKAGGSFAVHRARRIFADAERRDHLDTQFEMRTAEQIADTLGHMKGAMMKLGQMVSYLDAGLPPHVREAMAQLQSDAPPMSAELAAGVIIDELGAAPTEIFAEWDPVPIASASIGQVHRAITKDGRAVAVKVQYPGIDRAIRADLGSANLIFAGLGQLFPGLDPEPVVEELKERLVEELDYTLEAKNQQIFVDEYRGHPTIVIPEVVHELSSQRVLTTELAEGVRFEEMLTWDDDARNRAAETIFRFVFRSLYRRGIFNGDPHPGNYLFRRDGSVVFLDFGLVKRFTSEEVGVFSDMIQSFVLRGDTAAFLATLDRIGLLPAGHDFPDELVEGYFGHFYEWVMADEEKTVTPEYASESVRRYFDATGPYGEIMKAANVPAFFVIIQRINLGLYALLGDMGATANWRRMSEHIWPFTDGPPSTPLGEAEEAWLTPR